MLPLLPNTCQLNRGALGGQCRCAGRGECQKSRQCGLNFTPLERGFLPCLWVFSAGTCQEQQNLLHHILGRPWGCFSLCWVLVESAEEPGVGWETFPQRTGHQAWAGRNRGKAGLGNSIHRRAGLSGECRGRANPARSKHRATITAVAFWFVLLLVWVKMRARRRSCPHSSARTVSRASRRSRGRWISVCLVFAMALRCRKHQRSTGSPPHVCTPGLVTSW